MGIAGDVRVQAQPFDTAVEIKRLTEAVDNVGAVVTFSGVCRDENGTLEALELEHYPGMAESELSTIATEAASRWPVSGLTVIHRHGRIEPGEDIVLVVASSTHRAAAFKAAEFVMDYLKTNAPFWKKEHRLADKSGTEKGGSWVKATAADDDASERWKR
jgi:molybdopterin synthase catalytic subunit